MAIDHTTQSDEVRVVLVDDHELFRGGLRDLLEAQGLSVVGESSISPRIATKVLARLRQDHSEREESTRAHSGLSEREVEVLRLLAEGKGNAQIAAELFISPKTVKNHIASILMKLQIENRIQAAVYAVRSGII